MIELMHTDLPEPVCPAISTWGIFAMSATMYLPELSLPRPTAIFEGCRRASAHSNTSRRRTISTLSLGISTPTAALPGIGASMRTDMAARRMAISSESAVMRLTFTPGAGCSSKRVTAGPWAMPTRRVSMPKEFSVSISMSAFSMSASLWACVTFC